MHKYKKKKLNLPGVAGSSVGTTVAGGEKQLFMNLTFIPEIHILHTARVLQSLSKVPGQSGAWQ